MLFVRYILILEDNLLVLSKLLGELELLEQDSPYSISVTVLTDAEQVERYINIDNHIEFDVILLDRDDKLNKSFHILNIKRLGVEKVISISTVAEYNDAVKKRGVTRVVEKDLRDIDGFAQSVVKEVENILASTKLRSL